MLLEVAATIVIALFVIAVAYLTACMIDGAPEKPQADPAETPVVRLYPPPPVPSARRPAPPSAADCERAIAQIEETRDRLLIKRKANRSMRDYTAEDHKIRECEEHIESLRRYIATVQREEAMS